MASLVRASSLPCARDREQGGLALLKRLPFQAAARIAGVAGGRDPLVLPVGEPRVARDVPQVREIALESVLPAQNLVDRASAAEHATGIVDRVQFLEQMFQLKFGKLRPHFFILKVERLHISRVVELADAVETRAAHLARAVVQNRELARRRLADAHRPVARAHRGGAKVAVSASTIWDLRASAAAARSPG